MHRKRGGGAKGNNASPAGSGNTKNNGASGADINNYAGQIKSAIESKFYDASSYAGKTCTLRIKLAPDGMLLDIKPEGGDPALCQAALAAAKLAKIPKPPSQAVYEVFKKRAIGLQTVIAMLTVPTVNIRHRLPRGSGSFVYFSLLTFC
ncbi:TolA protein [Escherichia coli ISC41]|nr:TolA protein [Escherichia coli ISC41]